MTIFHREPPEWLKKVADLRPGGRRRISDSELVSFNGKGYSKYDFREGELEVYEPHLSIAERLALLRAAQEATTEAAASAVPPLPAMTNPRDWPSEARAWMHKAHFSNIDILASGAYWNSRIHRVILPYTTLTGNPAWIARRIDLDTLAHPGRGPKYLFPNGVPRNGGAYIMGPEAGVVITEDLLSAWRVHWATGMSAVAAQGVSLDRKALARLPDLFAAVWLDPDKYGANGSARIANDLGAFGIEVAQIRTDLDPKYYDNAAIREVLLDQWGRA